MNRPAFRTDGTFAIVQFTDIHWQNNDPDDVRSLALMEAVLEQEEPDFVVFTGDIIHSELTARPDRAFVQAVSAVASRAVPWHFVFGNHDAEAGITKEALREIAFGLPGYAAQANPTSATGYACMTIGGSSHPARDAAALHLFDSGSYAPVEVGGPSWIGRDQIDEYVRESERLERSCGGPVQALAFFHIPLPEFDDAWMRHTCYGHNQEGVGCPRINSGLFHACRERGDVRGIFVGHDHVNDFWSEWYGIRLCYGRATGFNSYGMEGFLRGARVIRLYEDGRPFDTWLRLEDGRREERQPVHHGSFRDIALQLKKRI